MIYFDNAATTLQKPDIVYDAVLKTLQGKTGNPSRGSHQASLAANRVIFQTRNKLAKFFNAQNSKQIIFTKNATEAINLILKGLLEPMDQVIISDLEHNAVYRPLNKLRQQKTIEISIIASQQEQDDFLTAIKNSITSQTKLIAMTYASNVTGDVLPIKEIGKIAQKNNIYFLVDAAQTAGSLPIDVQQLKADFLAFTGHKGLYGPQGTGGLYLNHNVEIDVLLEGGTGGNSKAKLNPDILPDKYESGTLNTPGIAGLGAGIDFINKISVEKIYEHKTQLINKLLTGLATIEKVEVYSTKIGEIKAGVISFRIKGIQAAEIGEVLDRDYDIAVRTGLHCAPLAHKSIGTYEMGTVRVSLSYFNTLAEIDQFLQALNEIIISRS